MQAGMQQPWEGIFQPGSEWQGKMLSSLPSWSWSKLQSGGPGGCFPMAPLSTARGRAKNGPGDRGQLSVIYTGPGLINNDQDRKRGHWLLPQFQPCEASWQSGFPMPRTDIPEGFQSSLKSLRQKSLRGNLQWDWANIRTLENAEFYNLLSCYFMPLSGAADWIFFWSQGAWKASLEMS